MSHVVRCSLIGLLMLQRCPPPCPRPVPLSYALQEVPPYSAATSISRRLQLYPSEEALSAGGVLDLEVHTYIHTRRCQRCSCLLVVLLSLLLFFVVSTYAENEAVWVSLSSQDSQKGCVVDEKDVAGSSWLAQVSTYSE